MTKYISFRWNVQENGNKLMEGWRVWILLNFILIFHKILFLKISVNTSETFKAKIEIEKKDLEVLMELELSIFPSEGLYW